MKYTTLLAGASAIVIGLGLAGASFAQTVNNSGNSGSTVDSPSLAIDHNSLAFDSPNQSVNVGGALSASKTVSVSKNIAKTDQDLKGVVVGNSYNFNPQQAAAAAAARGGDGGSGGGGLLAGGNGGSGGTAAAAGAGSTGNQPIQTGNITTNGAAFQNFAGISTVSFQTGIGSNALAASGVTANSSVSFGHQ
jgi:hypothetical protein